ncbi:acyl-CoA dehydrogenase family protein [Noviherbaspirillum autotrophicum]|uniref:Acyl-[acyl-carrier-protein] dehydrogenase MbtN n=1 Tax=Noviherbaspirillum autotrophicum TaxID=709839 RepID=A0A0C2BRT8_9BURK|nr:acyl-CoA dehydrogenase family protein [Noviherbaspirillum autotrophicum]KIF82789.1 acyl-CoA dehydrogenase [Noviherbaspirillum autotrophicum]
MIPRQIFNADHDSFRHSFRRFLNAEVMPRHEQWEEQGFVDPAIWRRAGELGFLCTNMPERVGGAGCDRLFSAILLEELARANATGIGWPLHSDIVAPYLLRYGSEELQQAWLPKMAAGEAITAIAMTEPGGGSDLQSMATVALEDGDDYVINGSKIFITNGYNCDMAIVAVKTGSSARGAGNVSLIVVEADRAGFTKGKPLKKAGMKAQDTCELFFDNVRVPRTNIVGQPGMGFMMLMQELAWERLLIAITSIANAEAMLEATIAYTKERQAFGRPVSTFQHTRFALAEMKTELQIARVFVDRCLELEIRKELQADAAAAAKYWCSDLQGKVLDQCVQLHGGYGFMLEYPVARAYVDARAQRIYGGTNEIMKEIIARGI